MTEKLEVATPAVPQGGERPLRDRFPAIAAAEPEVLAHHYTQAGLDEPAIEWWDRAGEQALHRSAFQEAEGYFLEGPLMSWAGTHYLPSGVDINDPRLSPLRAPDLSGLPPAHIHTAGYDLLRDEGKAYADALERAGVKVRHLCHEHMIHHFYAMAGAIPYARTALKAVGADVKAALSTAKALSAV
jgi:acetyl esterase/lipase